MVTLKVRDWPAGAAMRSVRLPDTTVNELAAAQSLAAELKRQGREDIVVVEVEIRATFSYIVPDPALARPSEPAHGGEVGR
jgi:hypothetical protein